jgi:hypothetical protein
VLKNGADPHAVFGCGQEELHVLILANRKSRPQNFQFWSYASEDCKMDPGKWIDFTPFWGAIKGSSTR